MIFVISTGKTHTVREFIQKAFSATDLNWEKHMVIDPAFIRPAEVDLLIGDAAKVKRDPGWKLEVDFDGLVQMMVESDIKRWKKLKDSLLDRKLLMNVLVTGAGGFVGAHIIRDLQNAGHTVTGMTYGNESLVNGATLIPGDINDPASVRAAVESCQLDGCIYLADQAFVPTTWDHPQASVQTNVNKMLNLLEACHHLVPGCRIVAITSLRAAKHDVLDKNHALNPTTLYGVTKVAVDLANLTYAHHYGMHTITAHPQNNIGPGQSPCFAISNFVAQIAQIAAKKTSDSTMRVGNLDSMCDFSDVRDVICTYRLLMEKGQAEKAYNITIGKNIPMCWMVKELYQLAQVCPMMKVDPEFFRPTDVPPPPPPSLPVSIPIESKQTLVGNVKYP